MGQGEGYCVKIYILQIVSPYTFPDQSSGSSSLEQKTGGSTLHWRNYE